MSHSNPAAFHSVDLAALSPLLVLLCGGLLLLLLESYGEAAAKRWSFLLTLATIALAGAAAVFAPASQNPLLTAWLKFDALARIFSIFFLGIGFCSTMLADSFFRRYHISQGEYGFFLLSCLFGLLLIGAAADFLTLFLGLEILSIALYVSCGYMKQWNISHEASMKYFLMGSLAAAFLLYGIALIYGAVGTTRFEGLSASFAQASGHAFLLLSGGIALITLGLAFKAAIVPFHMWAPDVYDGSPTPVTAFMSVGTKAGAFAALARVFLETPKGFSALWNQSVAWLAIPTLIYANYLALRQVQMRRFFAYSGISHAGFLLIPFAAGTANALLALFLYLTVYALATLGCFAVLSFLDSRKEGVMMHDLHGLFRRSPLLAAIFSLCLLTLAGIPPTAGFVAKFFVFKLAFEAGYYGLIIIALLTTILAAFYYLRIVAIMLSDVPEESSPIRTSWPAALVGVFSSVLIIFLSIYPSPFMHWLTSQL